MPTREEKRMRGQLITTFRFINQFEHVVDTEQVFERFKDRVTRGRRKKLSKELVGKDVKV